MPGKTGASVNRRYRGFRAVAGCIAILISAAVVPPGWARGDPEPPTKAVQDRSEELLLEIGEVLIADEDEGTDGILLHASVDKGRVTMAIFEDRGDRVWYLDRTPDRLSRALLELWRLSPPEGRWAELEYVVQDEVFTADFVYPREIDPDEDPVDRIARIVVGYFGPKRISLPSASPDDAPT